EGNKVALLNLGGRLGTCLKAAEDLKQRGISTTVADARFAKPLDTDLIVNLVKNHELVITIEEGSIGGFSSHVLHYLAANGLLQSGAVVKPMTLPDAFIGHGAPDWQYRQARLEADDIVVEVLRGLKLDEKVLEFAARN
ncbi:MAG: transketolase C-terminal domain-containing protein, partial [Pseudomonadota bacterium]